jgi:hypothetical protein
MNILVRKNEATKYLEIRYKCLSIFKLKTPQVISLGIGLESSNESMLYFSISILTWVFGFSIEKQIHNYSQFYRFSIEISSNPFRILYDFILKI